MIDELLAENNEIVACMLFSSPITKDMISQAEDLWKIPFIMHTLGHRSLNGHKGYAHGGKLYRAYVDFFSWQTKESWSDMQESWGGKETFEKIAGQIHGY